MLRALASRLSHAFLWIIIGALIVIAAQLYGPTLLAGALPEGLRPADHTKPGRMTPTTIMDALEEIRGTLE